jgi:hypothetical protein
MKKSLLISLTCLASCAFAQKSFFGVEAGINIANQRFVQNMPSLAYHAVMKNAVRGALGAFFHYNFGTHAGVRLSAQFSSLGYQSSVNSQYDVAINYLTLPVAFFYRLNKYVSLTAGPYLSFTINNTSYNNGQTTVAITSVYHKNDAGYRLGAQFDVYRNCGLSVNYIIGTKNIWLDDQNGTMKYTNRALQFTLIYKFKKTI